MTARTAVTRPPTVEDESCDKMKVEENNKKYMHLQMNTTCNVTNIT